MRECPSLLNEEWDINWTGWLNGIKECQRYLNEEQSSSVISSGSIPSSSIACLVESCVNNQRTLSCLDEVEEAMGGKEFLFTSPWCILQQGPTQSRRRIWWRSCRAPTVSPFCSTMMMMVMRLGSPQPVTANKDEVVFHQVDQHLSHQLPHVHAWAVLILEQS